MLVNDVCSSYRVSYFFFGCQKICTMMDWHVRSVTPTPLQSAKSMALRAMVVECESFIFVHNGRRQWSETVVDI